MGLAGGNHRYWSHRAFKANIPYQILVMILSTTAYQVSQSLMFSAVQTIMYIFLKDDVIYWCRNHRVHHKFAETDSDPHDARRGFFFSHAGWLLLKDRPEVLEKSKQIDMTDLTEDPILKFQLKYQQPIVSVHHQPCSIHSFFRYFYPLTLLFAVLLPTIVPILFWGETLWISFNLTVIFRYTIQIHAATSVNSFAHLYGNQPYDKSQGARQSKIVSLLRTDGHQNFAG